MAIKTPKDADAHTIQLFLDEAKTMLQIGKYHDFIVNLQGIILKTHEDNKQVSDVSK